MEGGTRTFLEEEGLGYLSDTFESEYLLIILKPNLVGIIHGTATKFPFDSTVNAFRKKVSNLLPGK